MRVAVVVNGFPKMSETFVIHQIVALLERGHEVDIFPHYETPPHSSAHAEIERYQLLQRVHPIPPVPENLVLRAGAYVGHILRAPSGSRARLLRACNPFAYGIDAFKLRLLRNAFPLAPSRSYDVIHCHFGRVGQRGAFLRELGFFQGKLLTTFHGFDAYPACDKSKLRAYYAPLFARADRILANSEWMRRRVIDLGCPASLVHVQLMGVDCDKFPFHPRTLAPGEPVRFFTTGRLVEKKGIGYAIEAVATLVARGIDCRYDVAGDGPLRGKLAETAQRLGVADRVRLLGWKTHDEVAACVQEAHVIVQPSAEVHEGRTIAVLEGMASGMPAVVSNVGGLPEVVKEGENGYLVPPRNSDALADAMAKVARDAGRWPAMGRAGRARVENEHRMADVGDSLVRQFEAVLERAQRGAA
jgi:colanic acid/amylovoran biosynthesis glycosyltransferase